MNTQLKFREDKGIKQADLNPNELKNNHKKVLASNADYYSEWAIENAPLKNQNPESLGILQNLLQPKPTKHRIMTNTTKLVERHIDANTTASFDEI